MATIQIDATTLTVRIDGLDRLCAFKRRITVPLAHVRGATADPGIAREPKGMRGLGTHVRGVIVAGTFRQDGERVFWDVHDRSRAVVIELAEHQYARLVVQVADPRGTVELINAPSRPDRAYGISGPADRTRWPP